MFGTARHFNPSFSYLEARLGAYPHSRGQFYQNFWCQSRAALVQDILTLSMATALWQNCAKNMALSTKAVSYTMQKNFNRNVGETEQNVLRHLFYAGAFAHCANWLVKFATRAPVWILYSPGPWSQVLDEVRSVWLQAQYMGPGKLTACISADFRCSIGNLS